MYLCTGIHFNPLNSFPKVAIFTSVLTSILSIDFSSWRKEGGMKYHLWNKKVSSFVSVWKLVLDSLLEKERNEILTLQFDYWNCNLVIKLNSKKREKHKEWKNDQNMRWKWNIRLSLCFHFWHPWTALDKQHKFPLNKIKRMCILVSEWHIGHIVLHSSKMAFKNSFIMLCSDITMAKGKNLAETDHWTDMIWQFLCFLCLQWS